MTMTLRSTLVPVALAVAVAAALAACGKTGSPAGNSAAADAPVKFDLSKVDLPSAAFNVADLDPSAAACDDLNAFVNRKWLAANPVPGDRTSWGSFEVLGERSLAIQHAIVEQLAAAKPAAGSIEAKIADVWRTGMDQAAIDAAGLAPLQPTLDGIAALSDGAGVAAWLRSQYAAGQGGPFSLFANADFKDSENVIAYAGQGGLGLPEKGYYFDEDKAPIRQAYLRYIAQLLELSGTGADDAARQAQAVLDFETRLAKASLSRIELRDPATRYNPVSATGANQVTPNFDWTVLFDTLKVPAAEKFSLAQPQFFAELDKMLVDTPVQDWQAYLRFHAIDDAAPYLAAPFEQANFGFYSQTLRGQKEMLPRWKRVLGSVNNAMGEALGQLYVQAAFPAQSKAQMQQLVDNLSAALKTRLENLDWMGDDTRRRALEKWASFTPKIGYPDKWRSWDGLQTGGDSYLANMQAARAFNYRYMLDKIGKPVDRSEWGMSPQTVNAYYNSTKNEIVFPAAILQPPFFDPDADPAVNYGGIGGVIGHEIIHGFDDQGRKSDGKGYLRDWWTAEDAAKFEAQAAKLGAQYEAYEFPQLPGMRINARVAMGENIGDLGGLTIALEAYRRSLGGQPAPVIDGFSGEQRFFMGWAQVWRTLWRDEALRQQLVNGTHSPGHIRAFAPLRNIDGWYDAFDIKQGDALYIAPEERVRIW